LRFVVSRLGAPLAAPAVASSRAASTLTQILDGSVWCVSRPRVSCLAGAVTRREDTHAVARTDLNSFQHQFRPFTNNTATHRSTKP